MVFAVVYARYSGVPQPPWIHEALAPKGLSGGRLLNRFRSLIAHLPLGGKVLAFPKFFESHFQKEPGAEKFNVTLLIITDQTQVVDNRHCKAAR
jgi:hypothetical protein